MMYVNGRWTLRGILVALSVDIGAFACDSNLPHVYTDVPKYNRWLQENMRRTM